MCPQSRHLITKAMNPVLSSLPPHLYALQGALKDAQQVLLVDRTFTHEAPPKIGQLLALLLRQVSATDDHYRDITQARVLAHLLKDRETIHVGHEQVQDHGVRRVTGQPLPAGRTALGYR